MHRSISGFWRGRARLRATSRPAKSSSNRAMPRANCSSFRAERSRSGLGNRLLETVSAYGIFGEMALIDTAPRSATAVAATDVKVVPIAEKQFLFLISNTPHFALNMMRTMARRLRNANTSL
jgi:CRP-like cAMP-binding protein